MAFLLDLGAEIRADHGTRAILLTLADWAAIFVERNSTVLERQFVFPQSAPPILHTLLNRWGMHMLANEHRIPTPDTSCPGSLGVLQSDYRTDARANPFPRGQRDHGPG